VRPSNIVQAERARHASSRKYIAEVASLQKELKAVRAEGHKAAGMCVVPALLGCFSVTWWGVVSHDLM
jgi:hypothetical protein